MRRVGTFALMGAFLICAQIFSTNAVGVEKVGPQSIATGIGPIGTIRSGTLEVTFVLHDVTKFPANSQFVCTVNASAADTALGTSAQELSSTLAAISGDTGTCPVTLPYYWAEGGGFMGLDTMNISYTVTVTPPGNGNAVRVSTQTIAVVIIPGIGVTSSYLVNVLL